MIQLFCTQIHAKNKKLGQKKYTKISHCLNLHNFIRLQIFIINYLMFVLRKEQF